MTYYVSPLNSSYSKKHPGSPYPDIEAELSRLSNYGDLIVCCDANARTKTIPDSIYDTSDNEYTCLPDDLLTSHSIPRNNSDRSTNAYTTEFIDMIIAQKLYILNGRSLGDLYGSFTCEKINGKSTVDYFLTNRSLMNHVISLKVQSFTIYSDHRPLELIISVPNKFRYDFNAYQYTNMPLKHKWKTDSGKKIIEALNTPKFNDRIDEILHKCAYRIYSH